jgi:hypothetical protein
LDGVAEITKNLSEETPSGLKQGPSKYDAGVLECDGVCNLNDHITVTANFQTV